MITLSEENIKEISESLEMGMRCFYNPEKEEFKALPDFANQPHADRKLWGDEIDQIDLVLQKCVVFEPMSTSESFKIMEEFVEIVGDEELQERLYDAIHRWKPFRNFKYQIDSSENYRQLWFYFKGEKYIEYTKQQLSDWNRKKK